MPTRISRGGFTLAVLVAAVFPLSACLLSPGRFTSNLDIREDGSFSFSYIGEIHMLALSKLGEIDKPDEPFSPSPCHDNAYQERPCTEAETGRQQREWQESRDRSSKNRRQGGASMKAMLGGIAPSDPRAAEELAQRLRRQTGWRKVDYRGDGLFDVDFAIAGGSAMISSFRRSSAFR